MPLTDEQVEELNTLFYKELMEGRWESKNQRWYSPLKTYSDQEYVITSLNESKELYRFFFNHYSLYSNTFYKEFEKKLGDHIEFCLNGESLLFSIETKDKKRNAIIEVQWNGKDWFFMKFLEIPDSMNSPEHFRSLIDIATALWNCRTSEEIAKLTHSFPNEITMQKAEEEEGVYCPFESLIVSEYRIAPLHNIGDIEIEFSASFFGNMYDLFVPLHKSGQSRAFGIYYPANTSKESSYCIASFTMVRLSSGYWRYCLPLRNVSQSFPIEGFVAQLNKEEKKRWRRRRR